MLLCKHIPLQLFTIWEPKYSTKRVLLKADKVRPHNKVVFTKAPSMGTEPYYISGKIVKKYKKEFNGQIFCHSVPLEELKPLTLEERCEHSD